MIVTLVLAAAPSSGSSKYPISLIEFNGTSLLEKIVAQTRLLSDNRYAFTFLEDELARFHLDKIVRQITTSPTIVSVRSSTKGSGCTALLSAAPLDPDGELLIVSANELVDMDLRPVVEDFRRRNLDAGTITFHSLHPRYSYVRCDGDGLVVEAAQQEPISDIATAGIFWFARVSDFVEAAKKMISKHADVNGNFYLAPTLNELILAGRKIGTFQIDVGVYKPIKDERQRAIYEEGRA